MHAYDKSYLANAQNNLGNMLEYAVNDLQIDLAEYYDFFLASELSEKFSRGDCRILAGMNGTELAMRVLEEQNIPMQFIRPNTHPEKTPEYWTGWALAYYQWDCGLTFRQINREIKVQDVRKMYDRYHEEDIQHFSEAMRQAAQRKRMCAYVKYYRKLVGMSQSELAEASGIPLRTIQQYEQKQKNINKASADYVIRLARVLGVRPEELLEQE